MQVFKTYFRIAKKQIHSMVLYIGIFGAIMLLMSVQNSREAGSRFQSKALDITVIDEDHSEASRALVSYLGGIHHLVELPDQEKETLFDNLYHQRISYVLIIPANFEERLRALNMEELVVSSKPANSGSGYFVDQQIDEYLGSVRVYLCGGYTLEKALEKTADGIEGEEEVKVIDFNAAEESVNAMMVYFFQYFPYIFLSVMILGMGPILIVFRKQELQWRMQCSAISQRAVNFQLILSCTVYTFSLWLLFMIGALLFYGPSDVLSRRGLLLMGNSAAFLPVGSAITLLLSTLIRPSGERDFTNVLSMVANVVSLGMSFLCGIFVPQYMLGDGVLAAAHFLPAYWYVRNSNMIGGFSDETMSFTAYWICIGMQLLFFVALFAVYLVASRQRRQKQVK